MSIYENLANSDFMEPGKFKQQLEQMSKLQDSHDSEQPELVKNDSKGKMKVSDFDQETTSKQEVLGTAIPH